MWNNSKPAKVRPKKGKKTRCLGPGPEHTFLSPNPTKIRICPTCSGKRPPPIAERAARSFE